MEYSEKERNILKQVLNGMKIGNIAEENGITLEELYIFLE